MIQSEKAREWKKRVPIEMKKAHQTLHEAQSLLKDKYWDGATSRGYYAIYHAARAVLYQNGAAPKTHRGVVGEFGRLVIKTGKAPQEYQEILQKARTERLAADYETAELETLPDPDLARELVEKAEIFVKKIEELLEI